MKATSIFLMLALVLPFGCKSEPTVDDEPLPQWLVTLIAELESQPMASPPAWIARYDYDGQRVYYLPPRCCDIFSSLYNSQGTIICHPDGGIAGGGDGRCPDFFAQRQNETIVWRDPRTPPSARGASVRWEAYPSAATVHRHPFSRTILLAHR